MGREGSLSACLAIACAVGMSACAPQSSGAPCTRWEDELSVQLRGRDEVDLLLVTDDSNAISASEVMHAALPSLLSALASGDHDGDGAVESARARSIHVGIVTTDLGVGGHDVPTCVGVGDAARLVDVGAGSDGCALSYPRFHVIESGGRPTVDVAVDLRCLTGVSWGGCGIERPLDAMLAALDPSLNPGFSRPGALLAVLVVTDEDDCSASDPSFYDPDAETLGELSLRCGLHTERLRDISSVVESLSRPDGGAGAVVFGALVGIPPETSGMSPAEILLHPAMEVRVDPESPTRLVPSCMSPELGVSFPPRRIVTLARELERAGAGTALVSLCAGRSASGLAPFAREIADRLGAPCLPTRSEDSSWAACVLSETLSAGEECDASAGRTPAGVGAEGRRECVVRALDREEALAGQSGWFYEPRDEPLPGSTLTEDCGGASAGRLRLIGAEAAPGAEHRLRCPRSIGPDGGVCER